MRLSDELLSQAVMVVESCRPTLTINLAGARQHWLEGMLRHEIGKNTHTPCLVFETEAAWSCDTTACLDHCPIPEGHVSFLGFSFI